MLGEPEGSSDSVGGEDGVLEGTSVANVGNAEGDCEGRELGPPDGTELGPVLGDLEGASVGPGVGTSDGKNEGESVGD